MKIILEALSGQRKDYSFQIYYKFIVEKNFGYHSFETEMKTQNFDVIIIGAGPAGTTCALQLSQYNLRVALVDKSNFPRDKICGDAIPGPAFKALHSISKEFGGLMNDFQDGQNITASKVISPSNQSFTINWFTKSYNSKRLDFDNFLFQLVREKSNTEIFEGVKVNNIISHIGNVEIVGQNQLGKPVKLQSKILIGADGTNGISAKKLIDFQMDKNHHCAAVRAYVEGIKEMESNTNEFYLIKNFTPGYFWIFPLKNGLANIGFGMLSKEISINRVSLKKALKEIIRSHPELKVRFEGAKFLSEIKGFGLPLGSRFSKISGEGFMLCGDAGSLIDPLQGHGIDKAMWSGKWAAEQAIKCIRKNQFDAEFMSNYDRKVYKKLGMEFRRNHLILKAMTKFPSLLNVITFLGQNAFIKSVFQKFT